MRNISTTILGISAFYHDSAAVIIKDGNILAASSQERFSRKKGDKSFPHDAINFCLNVAGININDINHIVFYEDYILKFERLLVSYHSFVPKSIVSYLSSMPKWITHNLWLENDIKKELGVDKKIIFCNHHMSHSSSAFYPSPYEKSAILTVDGVGEWATTTWGIGEGNKIKIKEQVDFPNSLGLLYSAFTSFCGFKINSGEYKLMGLAPYGEPIYADIIKKYLIHINDDGSVILNQKYFNFVTGLTMFNKKVNKLFGISSRRAESKITKEYMDIASSIQSICDECLLKMANYVYDKTKCENLVLAGGVALNVVSIGKIERESKFKNIWIQPASSDAGGALGAAYWCYFGMLHNKRKVLQEDSMKSAYLGLEIKANDLTDDIILESMGATFTKYNEDELTSVLAKLLSEKKIIALARGRAEFGPRALGNRSILADATDETMQSKLNLKVKKRESFRPFAPIVLEEDAKNYFNIDRESCYMLKTYYLNENIRLKPSMENDIIKRVNQKRSSIPAVTHVDYSSRVQTISKNRNNFVFDILSKYKNITGTSVLVNTSFNLRGQPIVNNIKDAYYCFMATDIDYLVIGNRLLKKSEQNYKMKKVKINLD